jgi:antitoxin component of MazEF toxin-antitoxin module
MEMRKAQKNGNSIAVNLPTQYASGARIAVGTLCEVKLDVNKRIIITPYVSPDPSESKP